MAVEEYRHSPHTWLSRLTGPHPVTDKQQATLDLLTGEKGFTFKADGKTEVKAKEDEGKLTLLLPHKTKFLVIEHPDYGQVTWKVPEAKGLRRKHHYQAVLHTSSPDKEFKAGKQWVVLEITPHNAIVMVDSTTQHVRDGKAQFFLSVGTHQYKVESPFHSSVQDSLQVTDSARLVVPVTLQPFYSYLTVKSPVADYDIYVDEQLIGTGEATSGHLSPGPHQVTLRKGRVYFYDGTETLQPAEKRKVEIAAESLQPRPLFYREQPVLSAQHGNNRQDTTQAVSIQHYAPVTIKAPNDSAEIWIDAELAGRGTWQGQLATGFHAVSTRENGLKASPTYMFIEDTFPKTLNMLSPEEEYGMLNIHSNVIGAEVLINDQPVGHTPCLVERLPARYSYKVTLRMDGYRDKTQKVKPRGNDLVDMNIKMKKKKTKL